MRRQKTDILLVGQTPPPYHGQSVVTGMLFDHTWSRMDVRHIRMAYSHSIHEIGHFSLHKITHLFSLVWQTWVMAIKYRPRVLYYLPASPRRIPILRDIIYLGLTRWMFPKTVFHFHAGGLPEYLDGLGILGQLARYVYAKPDLCVEICEADVSPGASFQSGSRVIVPNGVDVVLTPRTRPKKEKLHVLCVGALSEQKGLLVLLDTASILKGRKVDVEIHVVGGWISDAFRDYVHARIEQEGLGDIVYFDGILKDDAKWEAYANADVFILPSHYESENFPIVLIEALAFGLPVISTRWRGIPQLLGDEGAAILCDIKAPGQYADAIELLCEDAEMRKSMGGLARARYEDHFTREKFLLSMERVFERVLDD